MSFFLRHQLLVLLDQKMKIQWQIQRGARDLGNQIQGEFQNVLGKIKGGIQDAKDTFKHLLDQINQSSR
jgi:succinate dehydrogenase flavin-adding protein (antitoxin of CptAB toxin-antitoxin module)